MLVSILLGMFNKKIMRRLMNSKKKKTNGVCAHLLQRLLSNEEEKNKEIIQEVCFMVSFVISRPSRQKTQRTGWHVTKAH